MKTPRRGAPPNEARVYLSRAFSSQLGMSMQQEAVHLADHSMACHVSHWSSCHHSLQVRRFSILSNSLQLVRAMCGLCESPWNLDLFGVPLELMHRNTWTSAQIDAHGPA